MVCMVVWRLSLKKSRRKQVRASAGTARVMWFWWKPGDSVMVVPARNWRYIPGDSVMCGAGPELEVEIRRLVVWSDG